MCFKSSLLYAKKLLFEKNAGHGKRTLLGAIACIAISLVPLVAVLVISDGMIAGITGRIIGLSSQDISVVVSGEEDCASSGESLTAFAERISSCSGVVQAVPEVQGTALAVGSSSRSGATVRAVPEDLFESNQRFKNYFTLVEGSTSFETSRTAILGQKLASDLHVSAGDSIRLISISSMGQGEDARVLPKVTVLTVGGIVSCGYQELDALWLFVPLKTGFSVLPKSTSKVSVAVVTEDSFSTALTDIARGIRENVYGFTGEEPVDSAAVYLWSELNASQYENFASTKVLLILIMLLIVLVASINISSALIMLVMERRKEIAILKSLGASSGEISLSFLLTGFASGIGGVLIGLPLGLLASVNINPIISFMEKTVNAANRIRISLLTGSSASALDIKILDPAYYLQDIPVTIPFMELSLIVVGTLILSLLASSIPALRAGREKPIDTLRKM